MLKSLLGIAPQEEADGSFRPSKVALKLATSDITNYESVSSEPYSGPRSTVLVLFTEQKNMTMENGRVFSTGNHPVEALVPMLHLREAGFDFEVVTPTGKPVVFEMWAMPTRDEAVMGLYEEMKARFESPRSVGEVLVDFEDRAASLAALFVPGGHGSMLGIPEDPGVGTLLRQAHAQGLFTISICHGPGAFLATALDGQEFLYAGYEMAVFPDSVDKMTPVIGYLPGPMPWHLVDQLSGLGVKVVNTKADDTVCVDRRLITGASPEASNALGKAAASTLLEHLG